MIPINRHRVWNLAADAALVAAAWYLAFQLRFDRGVPIYYRTLLEGSGLTKAMDLYKWEIMPDDRDKMLPVIDELADRLEPEHGIRLRRMRRRNFEGEIRSFMDVYNEAWSHNWGFVPLTDAELSHMAKELKPVLDEDFSCVAETADGEVWVQLTRGEADRLGVDAGDAVWVIDPHAARLATAEG